MRPQPPDHLIGIEGAIGSSRFVPSPDLVEWARATFIDEGAALENPDHAHLQFAVIGALWTNVPNARHGRAVIGQAELGKSIGGMGRWTKARAQQQLVEWFGQVPDFVLTFEAEYATRASDAEFCALVEHELYHAGQERDAFGQPKFSEATGLPSFCIRPHDVEEFTGVVKRYGADAAHVRAFAEAALGTPEIAGGRIGGACGACVK